MGCPSECTIGDNLVFTVNIHDPDTAEAADADAVPTYRVYENETATPILDGSMALLDTANTTGFYSELIAVTAANGFENGKTYSIYIQAAVDAVVGTISYCFKAKTTILGAGADACTLTITAGGVAVADADVWITSDEAGTTVVAGTSQTDSSGQVTVMLDEGSTYYLWMQKDGVESILGEEFEAVAD